MTNRMFVTVNTKNERNRKAGEGMAVYMCCNINDERKLFQNAVNVITNELKS